MYDDFNTKFLDLLHTYVYTSNRVWTFHYLFILITKPSRETRDDRVVNWILYYYYRVNEHLSISTDLECMEHLLGRVCLATESEYALVTLYLSSPVDMGFSFIQIL